MRENNPLLDLRELAAADFPGITREKGAELAQAAAVCLQSQGHEPGVTLVVRGHFDNAYALAWPPVSPQARRTWNDPEETTEDGAVGLAALLAWREIGWPVILRSWKGTGFDYWLGDLVTGIPVYRVGLEVSGIRAGSEGQIRARLREKRQQVEQGGRQQWATYVIVVEFSYPQAEAQRNDPRA